MSDSVILEDMRVGVIGLGTDEVTWREETALGVLRRVDAALSARERGKGS